MRELILGSGRRGRAPQEGRPDARPPRNHRLAFCVVLAAGFLAACDNAPWRGVLHEARARGELRVATINAPTTYYLGRDGAAGFDHDLAAAFAEHLGLEMTLIVLANEAEVLEAVDAGEADLGAAGLAMSAERLAARRFAHYREVKELVVCRSGRAARDARRDLATPSIDVAKGSSQMAAMRRLETAGVRLNWRVVGERAGDALLAAVSDGTGECALADSSVYALNRRYYPRLEAVRELPGGRRVGWAIAGGLSGRGADLETAARDWLQRPAVLTLRQALEEKYFGFEPEAVDSAHAAAFLRAIDQRLQDWRALFEDAAQRADVPWTLVAAVAYQESHWDPHAVSPTGVRGLMMLTNATARALGVQNRRDPVQSARGGARYLRQLRERLPAEIPEDDRWWFAAASYNVGYGHVMDARRLADARGLDRNRWADVREMLPLLEDGEVYPTTRYGYARGREAQLYVRRVRDFADILEKRFDAQLTAARE